MSSHRSNPVRPPPAPLERSRLLELLQRYGWEAESFRCLSPGLEYWFSADGQGVVAYIETGGSWVAAGSVVCDPERLPSMLEAFVEAATRQRRRAILFAVEARTLEGLSALNRARPRFTWVKIGEQPVFDPRAWSLAGPRRTVRAQVRRAANHGVKVLEVSWEALLPGTPLRLAAEELIAQWQELRSMSPMGFLVDLHPFREAQARRYFIAERAGELEGLLAAVPVYARNGWFVEDLIRRPGAPNGTVEALLSQALAAFGAEEASYVTLGLAPLSGELTRIDPPSPGVPAWLPHLFRLCYHHANLFYSFRGLRQFREKFRPDRWEPVYMTVSPPGFTIAVLFDMLSAFVPGSRLTFAVDTGMRVARAVARRIPVSWLERLAWAFSLLLIPWILLLVSVDAVRYFGTTWGPWAWASFDAMMGLAFAALAVTLTRRRRVAWSLSRVMLGAVLADVWLTSAQVVLFNLPQARDGLDLAVCGIAVLAPVSAAVFLAMVSLALQPRAPWQG